MSQIPETPLTPASDPPRLSALRLEHWLAQHDLQPLDFIRLLLTGDAPVVADVAGSLVVFNEETRHWRARHVAQARLGRATKLKS